VGIIEHIIISAYNFTVHSWQTQLWEKTGNENAEEIFPPKAKLTRG
jgi:hypothetical protein